MSKNKQYDILDKMLNDSQSGRGDVVWIQDPRHPDGGYYVQASDAQAHDKFKSTDDIERFLRS